LRIGNKKRIVQTALELFNEHGSQKVSTNHIAKESAISTGNLYYHFKNKEAIIFEIFAQLQAEWETIYNELDKVSLNEAVVNKLLQVTTRFFWKYRFIYKELNQLILNDANLQDANMKMQARRREQLNGMIEHNIEAGILRDMSTKEKAFFLDYLWIVILFWHPFLDVTGQMHSLDDVNKLADDFMTLFKLFKA